MTYCYKCKRIITDAVCLRCNHNGITPALWLARGIIYLIAFGLIISLIAAPFFFTESEIKEIGIALLPLIIFISLFLLPCAGLYLCAGLSARKVRLK